LGNRYIDPTLEHDLTSPTKPWALSPLVSTMPHFMHTRTTITEDAFSGSLSEAPASDTPGSSRLSSFPPSQSIADDTSQLYLALKNTDSSSSSGSNTPSSAASSVLSIVSTSSNAPNFGQVKKALGRRPKRDKPTLPDFANASQRRSYFSQCANREAVELGPEVSFLWQIMLVLDANLRRM